METLIRVFKPVHYSLFFDYSNKEWQQDSANLSTLIEPSNTMGYKLIPHRGRGYFKVNSLGIMDRERSIEKEGGIFRIVALGDSITYGGMPTYVQFLEDILNKNTVGHKFEVWNCGVPAYNTAQEFNFLNYKCLSFKPDLVILQFCLNDFETTPIVIKEGKDTVIYWPKRQVAKFINPTFFKYSHLYRRIIFSLLFNRPTKAQEKYNIVLSSLEQMKNLLFPKDIKLFVIVFPYLKNYKSYDSYERWQYDSILNILNKLNIDFLDLTNTFHKSNSDVEELSMGDGLHPNSKGHKLVAEVIFKNLSDRLLLSKLR